MSIYSHAREMRDMLNYAQPLSGSIYRNADEDEFYMGRALAAYFRTGATAQPSSHLSQVLEHDGRRFVVFMNTNGVLAVYRIRSGYYDVTHGRWRPQLKLLKRWPKALEGKAA